MTVSRIINAIQDQGHFLKGDGSSFSETSLLAAKMFQLTEWVYQVRVHGSEMAPGHIVDVYVKCLQWYTSLFQQVRRCENTFILFLQ